MEKKKVEQLPPEEAARKKKLNAVPRGRGGGRPKGSPNKLTQDVKLLILTALEKAGGLDYLVRQARDNPNAFMALLGKIIPMQVTGEGGGSLHITVTKVVRVAESDARD